MFQRIGPAAYKADLSNTLAICKLLGNPERKFRSVHVAGTNGKGSSSHLLAAILQKSGYKTGLYTSPHLVDFRERIRINGKMIPKKNVIQFVNQYKEIFKSIQPSFFEWTVGLAFHYFAEEKVDIAVIEVGLGGRLDSTNVITPMVSLITNIGFDHVDLLGDTLGKIAGEKAGIIKKGIPVVISERQVETEAVFRSKAKIEKSKIHFAVDEYVSFAYQYKGEIAQLSVLNKNTANFNVYELGLPGKYQMKNIPGVLKVIDILKSKKFIVSESAIMSAFRDVRKLTGLRGRFEKIANEPLTIVDTGHNAEGLSEVIALLEQLIKKKLHIVIGMVGDKNPSSVLQLLPKKNVRYYLPKLICREQCLKKN
jgi:dihydrofolate synthase / folylpolyglutamate synthase